MQAERPCPFDLTWHQGILYLTNHSSGAGDESSDDSSDSGDGAGNGNACLSLWDRQGQLLKVHRLGEQCCHPNGVRVFDAPR